MFLEKQLVLTKARNLYVINKYILIKSVLILFREFAQWIL